MGSSISMPVMKHKGGIVLICGWLIEKVLEDMLFIDGTVNASLYTPKTKWKKKNPSLKKLGLRGILQYDNNPKHTATITNIF